MKAEQYLDRNEAVVKEIIQEVEKGLIFCRKNPNRENGILTSSVGKFYSQILEDEVFIALDEFSKSSAILKTIVNLAGASWYSENFTRPSDQVPSFYAVLFDESLRELGMIYQDLSNGGEYKGVPSLRPLDSNFSLVNVLRATKGMDPRRIPFPATFVTQLEINDKMRITDFSPLTTSLVGNFDSVDKIKLNRFIDDLNFPRERDVPIVVLPY